MKEDACGYCYKDFKKYIAELEKRVRLDAIVIECQDSRTVCSICREVVLDDHKFCPKCGSKLFRQMDIEEIQYEQG